MKWLKWIGIVVGALILIAVLAATWLLASQSGARFALNRVVAALDGELSYTNVSGNLASPLLLENVHYLDTEAGIDARIERLALTASLGKLLGRRVQIDELKLDGVAVALTTVPAQPQPPSSEPFSLKPPLDIALDQLQVSKVQINQDGKEIFVADTLSAGAAWTHDGITLRELALRAPAGSVDMAGTLTTMDGYAGDGKTTFSWKVADVTYAGTLDANSDGKQATIKLVLSEPLLATLDGSVGQNDELPWTLKLDAPTFNASPLIADGSVKTLAASLQGSGDVKQGSLSGEVAANGHRVQLDPLRYQLTEDVLTIDALRLRSPEAAGVVDAKGSIQFKAQPPSADFDLRWTDVVIPADLAGQALASHGQLQLGGSADAYRAEGSLSVGPPGKLSDLVIKLSGTPQQVLLDTLALKQAKGGLDANGTITLQPAIAWDIKAIAKQLNPGDFAAEWPGSLNFDLASTGRLTDQGPDAQIKLERLSGSLRQRAVSGNGDLAIKPEFIVDGDLRLKSGESTIELTGRGGNQTDATIKLAIGSLADWVPDAGGKLAGQFQVVGKWPALNVDGRADGSTLRFGDTRIATLDLQAIVKDIQNPSGNVDLKLAGLSAGSANYESVSLQANGNQASHQLKLNADGEPAGLAMELSGSSKGERWDGTLKTLALAAKDVPRFDLAAPAQLAWDGKRFTASDTCLVGDKTRLCVVGSGGADGSVDARYQLEELPLALLAKLGAADAPLSVEGHLQGNGAIKRTAAGALSGSASISSPTGRIDWLGVDGGEPREMLSYKAFAINAELTPNASTATITADLSNEGRIDGRVTINGAMDANPALAGQIRVKLNSLKFIELFTSEVANVQGRVEADYAVAGTLNQPELNGMLSLRDFASEVPIAGLKLSKGDIVVRALDGQRFVVEGSITSGSGALNFGGEGGLSADAPIKLTIKGSEVTAANIPAANVIVSPDLVIERGANGLLVTGRVDVPRADVDLTKLPGGGAAGNATSADVVIVDQATSESGTPLPVTARVTVAFGDKVKLIGFGFDGTVSGQLAVNETPGRTTVGTGTLNVGGTYKAYGQDLHIEVGRILFAGTQIDNPGLNIRAVRKIREDDITAGLNVRGTAQIPVLTVFSDPVMEQSEALSYLLTGKPLSSLNSGEGDMLGSAARALGTAGGDLLAKNIGSKLGVDDIGVADNAALGGAAFTVGKYLSPKLYLSYGVGIFEPGEVVTLRYIFNPRWNFETQNATRGSRAGINYRYER